MPRRGAPQRRGGYGRRPGPARGRPPRARRGEAPSTGSGEQAAQPRGGPALAAPSRPRPVELPETISVQELATRLGSTGVEVIKQLMRNGVMANLTQVVDHDTAALVAQDLGFQPHRAARALPDLATLHRQALAAGERAGHAPPLQGGEGGAVGAHPSAALRAGSGAPVPGQGVERPPVVTILGHVDHGKTTLLDRIRQSQVAEREAGGITQHIGAYQVEAGGKPITFLDTPGHEAFTAMRARGAQATDIAVLVVAANDGVMPQTIEAINHARAAGVPIVVAINKTDRPDANVDRVKQQLGEQGLVLEEWGGDVIAVPLSARTGEGVQQLLENLLVVAEVAELRADPSRLAAGVVIEAQVDRAKGPLATILVQSGTLRLGDPIVAGEAWGRVKALLDDRGRRVKTAGPSQPVEVLGLDRLPRAGDPAVAFPEDRAARAFVQDRQRQREAHALAAGGAPVLRAPADGAPGAPSGQAPPQELRLILKTDVQGSVEPIRDSLQRLSTPQARLRLLHAAAGSINEGDVLLAIASGATIIGFNAFPEPGARSLAQAEAVPIRSYSIIYTLLDEMAKALQGVLEPVQHEVTDGHAELRAVFTVGRRQKVAGAYITDGKVTRSSLARLRRAGKLIAEGPVTSLKRFKDDAREVTAGLECGIVIQGAADLQEGDALEFFHFEQASP